MSTFNELIDFTRSTTGTYLDSVVYGDELVTNGDFSDGLSGWLPDPNASVINGQLVIDGINQTQSCYQNITNLKPNTYYKFECDTLTDGSYIYGYSSFSNSFPMTGFPVNNLDSQNNKIKQFVVFKTTDTGQFRVRAYAVDGHIAIFDNVSVKEIIGGQVSGTPLLRTAAINEPRLEYDASGNHLGLLIEGARTNVLTRSNELLTDPWEGAAEIVESSIPSIAGGQCFKISSEDPVSDYRIQVGVASNGQTKSIWARTVSGTGTAHLLGHHSVPATLVTLTEQWQRFSLPVDDSEIGGFNFYAVDFRGSGTLSEILVFGAQLEAGAFPTSYIPTSGSTVNRGADVASLPVERFAYNQSKGSVVAFQETFGTTGNLVPWEIHTGDTNRIVYNAKSSTATIITGGLVQASLNHANQLPSVFYKQGLAFKKDDIASSLDASILTDTSGTIPTVSLFKIGTDYRASAMLNGHIKSIQYYPKRLSNTELQLLTQPSASPTMNLTFDGQATSTLVEGFHD